MLRVLHDFLWGADPKPKSPKRPYERRGAKHPKQKRTIVHLQTRASPSKESLPIAQLPHPIKRSLSSSEGSPVPSDASSSQASKFSGILVPIFERGPLLIEDPDAQKILASDDIKLPALRWGRTPAKEIYTGPLRHKLLRGRTRNRRDVPPRRPLPQSAFEPYRPRSKSPMLLADWIALGKKKEQEDAWVILGSPSKSASYQEGGEEDERTGSSDSEGGFSQISSDYLAVYRPRRLIASNPVVQPAKHHDTIIDVFSFLLGQCPQSTNQTTPYDPDAFEPPKSLGWLYCQRIRKLQENANEARGSAAKAERASAEKLRIETSMTVRGIVMDWDDMRKEVFRLPNPETIFLEQQWNFRLQDRKWCQLLNKAWTSYDETRDALSASTFPWPVLLPGPDGLLSISTLPHPDSPEKDITMSRILEFLFHPARIDALPVLDPRKHKDLTPKTVVLRELQRWCGCRCKTREMVWGRVRGEDRERVEKGWKVVRRMLQQLLPYFEEI